MGGDDGRKPQLQEHWLISSRAEFELLANRSMHFQARESREEGIGGVHSWEQWNVCSIYEDCGRKTCVKSIEIESGASHPPAREASMSDAKRLYRRGFY